MAGEVWTIEALKVHLDEAIAGMDRRINQRFDDYEGSAEATRIAAVQAADKLAVIDKEWRASANEWRGAMDDREDKLMSKAEAAARFDALGVQDATIIQRLEKVEKAIENSGSRGDGRKQIAAWFIAGVGAVATLMGIAATIIAIVRG